MLTLMGHSPYASLIYSGPLIAQENGHTASSRSQPVHADMSNGEIISDSEAEDEYQGLSATELMSLDVDLSWSFHMLLLELDEYAFEFNPATANTSTLRQGIKGARESLAMLEKLACWIDAGDMMQWNTAMKEHRSWSSWHRRAREDVSTCDCKCHKE